MMGERIKARAKRDVGTNGKRFTTDVPGVQVIRYRDGRVRYRPQLRISGRLRFAYFDGLEDAKRWHAAQVEARAALPPPHRGNQGQHDDGWDVVERLVTLLGWPAHERLRCWDLPVGEDPIAELGEAAADILGRNLTLREIGLLYGVTRERVRQIEAQALRFVRASRGLSEYRP